MKKKTNEKNNQRQKTIATAIIIIIVIASVSGGTYSWWIWQSASANDILVNVSPTPNSQLTITGTNITNANTNNTSAPGLMPIATANCATSKYTLIGEATVTAINGTGSDMIVTPRLDVTLTPVSGRTLTSDNKSHLHWAVVDTTSSTSKTCASSPNYQGTFNSIAAVTVSGGGSTDVSVSGGSTVSAIGTTATINITNISNSTVSSTLTFTATKNSTTTKKYKVYVWLDSGYTHTNTGTTVSDPMQDLTISVKWSDKSSMVQIGQ